MKGIRVAHATAVGDGRANGMVHHGKPDGRAPSVRVTQEAYTFGIHLGTAGKIVDPNRCIVQHLGEQYLTAHEARSKLMVLGLEGSPAPIPFFKRDRIGCERDVGALREFGSISLIRMTSEPNDVERPRPQGDPFRKGAQQCLELYSIDHCRVSTAGSLLNAAL